MGENVHKKVVGMKVLFINPPWFEGSTFDRLISSNPPLGIAYIAAYLKKNGYIDVEILDMKVLGLTFDEIELKVRKIAPHIVAITAATGQLSSASKIIGIIKKINPKIITVIGGAHPSALPERTLREVNADVCVIGEGEATFLELVKAIEKNGDLKDVDGICFKNRNKKMITNKRRKLIENLDELPFPDRDLLPPLKAYMTSNFGEDKLHTSVMTSRGCPFGCKFCDKSIFGRTSRLRSVKNVVDEIDILVKNYGVNEIRFFDDLFTVNERRVRDICDEIMKRGLKFSWCCEARVNTVNPKMLRLMKEAGCRQIDYGIESGAQEILDLLNKGTTLDQIRTAVKWTNEAGIKIKCYFVLGLPGETKEHIRTTINFAKSLDIDYAAFFLYSPYPGTPLYGSLSKYGRIIASNWDEYVTFEAPAFLPKGLNKKELELLYKRAFYEFYFRPKYILKIIKEIKSASALLSYIKAGIWAVPLSPRPKKAKENALIKNKPKMVVR